MSLGFLLRSSHFRKVMEHRLGYGFRRLLSVSENVAEVPVMNLLESACWETTRSVCLFCLGFSQGMTFWESY